MPTHEEWALFLREYASLSRDRQVLFIAATKKLVADQRAGKGFRPSLRVKGVQGHAGVFETTWEKNDGRATFSYGQEVVAGEPHIIWRRIGGHDILNRP